ncbi:hypothetical protein ADUPG1_013858 [Aduncisulcus paluster]|uniref:ARID domain-containing protein n=1 Tax=Aduncisulcus paluster TaxID=2918883 RepID=A0ABQ5K4F9_9EUKA|nr:hypothetical protein ADUPG1_013858 [Aduncisulcus paluster]
MDLTEIHTSPYKFFEYIKGLSLQKGLKPSKLSRMPIVFDSPLDLFKLYTTIRKFGGISKVTEKRMFRKVSREMGFPDSISNISHTLKKHYNNIILPIEEEFERIFMIIASDKSLPSTMPSVSSSIPPPLPPPIAPTAPIDHSLPSQYGHPSFDSLSYSLSTTVPTSSSAFHNSLYPDSKDIIYPHPEESHPLFHTSSALMHGSAATSSESHHKHHIQQQQEHFIFGPSQPTQLSHPISGSSSSSLSSSSGGTQTTTPPMISPSSTGSSTGSTGSTTSSTVSLWSNKSPEKDEEDEYVPDGEEREEHGDSADEFKAFKELAKRQHVAEKSRVEEDRRLGDTSNIIDLQKKASAQDGSDSSHPVFVQPQQAIPPKPPSEVPPYVAPSCNLCVDLLAVSEVAIRESSVPVLSCDKVLSAIGVGSLRMLVEYWRHYGISFDSRVLHTIATEKMTMSDIITSVTVFVTSGPIVANVVGPNVSHLALIIDPSFMSTPSCSSSSQKKKKKILCGEKKKQGILLKREEERERDVEEEHDESSITCNRRFHCPQLMDMEVCIRACITAFPNVQHVSLISNWGVCRASIPLLTFPRLLSVCAGIFYSLESSPEIPTSRFVDIFAQLCHKRGIVGRLEVGELGEQNITFGSVSTYDMEGLVERLGGDGIIVHGLELQSSSYKVEHTSDGILIKL